MPNRIALDRLSEAGKYIGHEPEVTCNPNIDKLCSLILFNANAEIWVDLHKHTHTPTHMEPKVF